MNPFEQIISQLNRIEKHIFRDISPWLTIREAALYMKKSDRSIRRMISSGNLKSNKLLEGGHRLNRRDLDAYILFGKPFNKLTRPQKEEVMEATRDQW